MAEAAAPALREPKTFPEMLKAFLPQIQAALPRHINGDRMARIALTSFRMNPRLGACDPRSVFACVIQASQMGLEPGLAGHAFLVPYRSGDGYQCQLIPGWRGLVDLVNRTGRATVWTGAVFQGDKFSYQMGDTPHIDHVPGDEDDPDKLLYAYAVGRVKGHEWPIIEVWSAAKLTKHRNRFNKVGKDHYSYQHWEMYARKVPLLQIIKYLPSNPELEAAWNMSYAADAGLQNLTIDGSAIELPDTAPPADALKDKLATAAGKAPPPAPKQAPKPPAKPPAKGQAGFISAQEILTKVGKAQTETDLDEVRDLKRGLTSVEEGAIDKAIATKQAEWAKARGGQG